MVVLESQHHNHTHSGSKGHGVGAVAGQNQYLQPDYLSPTTLDSKKSPLAMLVQTCSQIGADSPTPTHGKHHGSSQNHAHSGSKKGGSPPNLISEKNHKLSSSPSPPRSLANTPPGHRDSGRVGGDKSPKIDIEKDSKKRHCSSTSSIHLNNSSSNKRPRSSSSIASASTISPQPMPHQNKIQRLTPPPTTNGNKDNKEDSSSKSGGHGHSGKEKIVNTTPTPHNSIPSPVPTIRPGIEVLNGNSHRYPPSYGYPTVGGGGYSPYPQIPTSSASAYANAYDHFALMSSMLNPAFREMRLPPQMGPSYFSHPALYSGIPPSAASPYLQMPPGYFGGVGKKECKDPYCTGCLSSPQGQGPLICPVGCGGPCDHQKVPYSHLQLYMPPPPNVPTVTSASSNSPNNGQRPELQGGQGGKPHVCNWIVGDNYCGKRFPTSEELLQHLRSHTSAAQAQEAQANANANTAQAIALQQHMAASAFYSQQQGHQGLSPANPNFLQQMQIQMQLMAGRGGGGPLPLQNSPPISPYVGKGLGGSGPQIPGYFPPNPYASLFPSRP